MATIGFNFTRMLVERKTNANGQITVSNNISIVNVEQYHLAMTPGANNALAISFKFELKYNPEIGNILLEGQVLELVSEQEQKDTVASWKEKKVLKKEMLGYIMQTILARCQIQGIILAKELNLPSPIPLPKIKLDENKAESVTEPSVTKISQSGKGKR